MQEEGVCVCVNTDRLFLIIFYGKAENQNVKTILKKKNMIGKLTGPYFRSMQRTF